MKFSVIDAGQLKQMSTGIVQRADSGRRQIGPRLGLAFAIDRLVGLKRRRREREAPAGRRTAGNPSYGVIGWLPELVGWTCRSQLFPAGAGMTASAPMSALCGG